jgi:hypothetical protein
MVIPNPLEISTNLACPQTPNTGGFETSSGSAPLLLGATALGGFPDLKQVAWAGGRFGKIHIIDFGIWYYVGMKDQESHAALATQLSTASNPETAPEILRELSQHELIEVRQAVAMNPNTPIDVLWELVADFPNEAFQSSQFALIKLENPNWVLDIPESSLVRLLQRNDIAMPEFVIQESYKSKNNAVMNALVKQILSNPRSTTSQLEQLSLAFNDSKMVALHSPIIPAVIWHPNITIASLKRIAIHGSFLVQQTLVGYCLDERYALPESWPRQQILDEILPVLIANMAHEKIAYWILAMSALPRHYADMLLQKLSFESTIQFAKLSLTPGYILEKLVEKHFLELNQGRHDTNHRIRLAQALIKNPKTPIQHMNDFADSPYKAVRAQVARQIVLSADLFIQLAQDDYPRTRLSLLANRKISPHLLAELTRHPDAKVSQLAREHPNTPKFARVSTLGIN